MGLGKSLTSLLYAVKHRPKARPIVVVCPASLKWNWELESSKHFNMRSEILEGTKPSRGKLILPPPLIIINYDILPFWLNYLKKIKPQIVIIDESQLIGSRKTRRTRATKMLCKKVPHVIALSGTPLVNRPAELFPTLNIIRPDSFKAFFPFAMKFTNPKRTFWGWDFSGASNLPELHKTLLKNCMSRVRKIDVLDQLPAKQRTVVPLEIRRREDYELAVDDFLIWLSREAPGKVRSAARAQRLVQIGYLKRFAARLKLRSVYEWLDRFLDGTDEKIILFCIHKKIMHRLKERYDNISVLVDGSVTGRKRQDSITKFLTNRRCRILIGQITAAGVGWSAKGVSNVAFVEIPWTPGAVVQAEDRVHGIKRGQKGVHASIWFLIARDTIESKLLQIIQKKQRVVSATLDGKRLPEDLNVYDELCRLLKKGKEHGHSDNRTLHNNTERRRTSHHFQGPEKLPKRRRQAIGERNARKIVS